MKNENVLNHNSFANDYENKIKEKLSFDNIPIEISIPNQLDSGSPISLIKIKPTSENFILKS